VLITATSSRYNLQHAHPSTPHYNSKNWAFTRGAAAAIYSNFGFIGHHLSTASSKPVLSFCLDDLVLYEATEAIKPAMGSITGQMRWGNGGAY